ncbi:MAG TPA: ATP-binding protein, partial [Chthoniobacteraceae bacterium]|nr:ATP-binding protein [Chthoniobacteraceae bacterium]
GQLTGAFNQMLARIQEQAGALHAARGELQKKVIALEGEITERKAAEARVAELNRQLVETSRQAGMAEVATGVLHNVGNVLNSVNIAASTVIEKLRASKVDGLGKAVALMAEHEHDLGVFLTSDAQGQRLPGYLRKLSGLLTEENADVRGELEQLGKHIEHIKEIVAMQQSYARATGLIEDVPAASLIDDALELNRVSFDRHGIEISRDIPPVPAVRVDKHKVLQILTNLLRNAKHAVEDAARPDPSIRIAVDHAGDRVRIAITDNGVGIPPQNLTHVFRHGFTTKKNGHGFGLHSGANAAKEMGGTLTADSLGPGLGATFTLELPVAANSAN